MTSSKPDKFEKAAYLVAALATIAAILFAIWGEDKVCNDRLNLKLGEAELDIPVLPAIRGGAANPAIPHPKDKDHTLSKAPCRGDEPAVRSVAFSAATPQQKALYQSQGYHYLPFLTIHLNSSPQDPDRVNCVEAHEIRQSSTDWHDDPTQPALQRAREKGSAYYAAKKPLLYGRLVFVTCAIGIDKTNPQNCHMALATDAVSIQLDFSDRDLPSAVWPKAMGEVERFIGALSIYPTAPDVPLPNCS